MGVKHRSCVVCGLQFYQGMPQQAVTLIEEVLTVVLSHGGLYDSATAKYLWTRCRLASAGRAGKTHKHKGQPASRTYCPGCHVHVGWRDGASKKGSW